MLIRIVIALLLVGPAWAQQKPAPVREEVPADYESVRQRAQMRVSAAYRELGEAQYRVRLAEQEVWAAEENYRPYAGDAAEAKGRVAKAQQALASAKAQEAGARAVYDKALLDVERIQRSAQPR